MKATLFISTLSGGGAEGVCVSIANGLVKNGWKVDLLVLNLDKPDYMSRLYGEVNIVNLGVSSAKESLFRLLRYLKQTSPSSILVFNYELTVILVMVRLLSNIKFKIIARNINAISRNTQALTGFWNKHIVLRLINALYGKADHVVNQCKAMEADLLAYFPSLLGKTSVIYNPVNPVLTAETYISESNPSQQGDYFLFVGRLVDQKDLPLAIEAFNWVHKKDPNVHLKIVGQGPDEPKLRALVGRLGLEQVIDFEGFQSSVIHYYLSARATILTSKYEGFPNVLVESITLGTPVVAVDCVSGPSEIVRHGINGYLVTGRSPQEFAEWMLKISVLDRSQVRRSSSGFRLQPILKQYEALLRK